MTNPPHLDRRFDAIARRLEPDLAAATRDLSHPGRVRPEAVPLLVGGVGYAILTAADSDSRAALYLLGIVAAISYLAALTRRVARAWLDTPESASHPGATPGDSTGGTDHPDH